MERQSHILQYIKSLRLITFVFERALNTLNALRTMHLLKY